MNDRLLQQAAPQESSQKLYYINETLFQRYKNSKREKNYILHYGTVAVVPE